ncbi:MAG: methylated-DNA--[protein]-cysteine S-methyltransferase [Actinobacteria bacterium]|nr:methylated-DNA--[protein]-cysteine S-methyltransferase [Actinomycetota bacterium]
MSDTILISQLDSPIGTIEIAVRDGALVVLKATDRWGTGEDHLARRYPDAELEPHPDPAGMVSALARYFGGDVRVIDDLPVEAIGTPFQEAVWKALRTVPAGETATYGEIARQIGAPRAVRAVGSANGANPVGVVVPCHRIVPASGGIGNYGGGVDRKQWLLEHEARHT